MIGVRVWLDYEVIKDNGPVMVAWKCMTIEAEPGLVSAEIITACFNRLVAAFTALPPQARGLVVTGKQTRPHLQPIVQRVEVFDLPE